MKLFVTDAEINNLLPRLLPVDLPVEDVRVRLSPEGLVLQGVYPALGFRVAFEMLWELIVGPQQVEAHLKARCPVYSTTFLMRPRLRRSHAGGRAGASLSPPG